MRHKDSKYAVCPFYRGVDKQKIYCEGLVPQDSIIIAFASESKKKEYVRNYCDNIDNYDNCRVCDMLNLKFLMEEGRNEDTCNRPR